MNKKTFRNTAITTMAATATVAAVAPAAAADEVQFEDVNQDSPHYNAIMDLVEQGAIDGDNEGNFNPYEDIDRGQVAKILTNVLDLETPQNMDEVLSNYDDVDVNDYYAEEISAVTAANIFGGTDDNQFNTWEGITREQMAKVLVNAYGLNEYDADEVELNKENISEKHVDFVQKLVDLGISENPSDFDAWDNIHRDQFSSFVVRTQEVVAEHAEPTVESVSAINATTVEVQFEGQEEPVEVELDSELEDGATTVSFEYDGHTYEDVELAEEFTVEPAVESVSAINAKEVEVDFNNAVDPATVFTDGESGTLIDGNVVVEAVGSEAQATGGLSGELSEDGKTLTLTATNFYNGSYAVTVSDAVETEDGEALEAFSSTFEIEDETAPTVSDVAYDVDTGDITVSFSEPLEAEPTTLRLNGEPVDTNSNYSFDGDKVTFANTATAGETADVYVAGAEDFNGNQQPLFNGEVFIEKPSSDALAVNSLSQVDNNVARVKFNKEVAAGESTDAATAISNALTVIQDGSATDASVIVSPVAEDETGRSFNIAIGSADGSALYEDGSTNEELTFLFEKGALEDTNGNEIGVYNNTVEFNQDVVGPEALSAKASEDDSALNVTFDEALSAKNASNVIVRLDGVDKTVNDATIVGDESKVLQIKLEDESGNVISALKEGTYTVRLESGAVTDEHTNDSELTSLTAEVNEDAAASTPLTVDTINDNGKNTFQVDYSEEVTTTALDASNYTLDGAALPENTDIYFTTDAREVVEIVLPEGSVNIGEAGTGTNAILGVENVVDTDGDVVEDTNGTVRIEDNTAAELQSAELVTSNVVKLTFNENVETSTFTLADDLGLTSTAGTFDASSGSTVATASAETSGNELIVTVTEEDSNWSDVVEGDDLEVEVTDSNDSVLDANGYPVENGNKVSVQ